MEDNKKDVLKKILSSLAGIATGKTAASLIMKSSNKSKDKVSALIKKLRDRFKKSKDNDKKSNISTLNYTKPIVPKAMTPLEEKKILSDEFVTKTK